MRRIIKWLMIASVAAACLLFIMNWFSAPIVRLTGDALDWRSRWTMGAGGIDCGRVKVGTDAHDATNCVLKAHAEGKPFRVRYDILGYDSSVAVALVKGTDGKVLALTFVGNPSGSGGTSLLQQHVNESSCPEPVHLWVNPKGRINCFQQQLSPPRDIMSPNAEPY